MSSEEIKAEYTSSLADLTFNSKPLINVLTILAEENIASASHIVEAIETHLSKVHTDVKLPILYLIDCIVKNVGGTYTELFSQNVVATFCSVFKVVDEKTRTEMFKLRQTWNDVFPQKKLYAIDVQIQMLDPAWPVTAQPPPNSIYFNPKFLKSNNTTSGKPKNDKTPPDSETLIMQKQLIEKQKELLELQQKKLELELLQTKVKLRESKTNNSSPPNDPRMAFSQQINKKPIGIGASAINHQRFQNTPSQPRINSVNTSKRPVNRDPRLQKQVNSSNTNHTESITQSPKSDITGKVKELRIDPRLNNLNKDVQPKQDPNKPKSPQKSRNESQKHVKSSSRNSTKNGSDSSLKSSSNSSVDSVEKKNEKGDKSKSINKTKRKDKYEEKKNSNKSRKTSSSDAVSPPNFKEIKVKSRNYMRRNRSPSLSPDHVQDVDLRSFGPVEKPSVRLQNESSEEKSNNKDIDLRQLSGIIAKKRPSTETLEGSPAKKSKSEVFDVLFGNEDTDLRKLSTVSVDRPRTPPPPIISASSNPDLIVTPSDTAPPKKNDNLEAVRAKLANASNKDKIFAKSFHKKKLAAGDQDHRHIQTPVKSDVANPIIISPQDAQCIKTGKLTKEQEKDILSKILLQVEKNKLIEAKKIDHDESQGDISTQTISDEDMDISYNSEDEREERERFKKEVYGTGITQNRDDKEEKSKPQHSNEDSVSTYPKFRERWPGHWRGGRRRHWDNPYQGGPGPHGIPPRPGIRPWLHPPGAPPSNWRHMGPPSRHNTDFGPVGNNEFAQSSTTDEDAKSPEGPSDLVVESTNQDDIKTINIDGRPREIRYYDEIAVIFMNWDDPREISFQDGVRRVSFNDNESFMLSFNEPYKDVLINGNLCKVRLGVPSREIYVNNVPYECYFGGPGVTIDLNGVNTLIKLDGPPPQVKIGTEKRTDLVAGRVSLIINAKLIIPVFLDAKVQKFVLDGETISLKFVDSLKTVLINDCPFNVEFGGLPKPVTIHDRKHYIRFSVLPKGIKPGYIRVKDMEGQVLSPPHGLNEENSRDVFDSFDVTAPALPIPSGRKRHDSPERNSNSPHFFQNFLQQTNLDVLSSVMAAPASQNTSSSGGYQVENVTQYTDNQSNIPTDVQRKTASPILPSNININDLFQKLVATGIVTTSTNNNKEPSARLTTGIIDQKPVVKRNPFENIREVTFAKPETLKVRQAALYSVLYSGMQCSSCGMRFPPEQSIHYSQHLDWHFRQNRKGKKNIRVASSRRWYYSLSDWKNYEEIEDLEEREKNFFDQQATQAEGTQEEAEEEVEIPTVPADPEIANECCEVCKDPFDQFFNEEKEEWHLRNAIRVDEKTYHPVCYDDYLKSLEDVTDASQLETITNEESISHKNEEIIPGLQIILDDDDDENPYNPEEVIIEESDDEKPKEEEKENYPEEDPEDDGDDDDVILNEVAPVKIVVDDDDDNMDDIDDAYVPTTAVKKERIEIDDGFEDVAGLITMPNGGHIKIKSEPVDPDELNLMDTTDTDLSTPMDKDLEDIEITPSEPHTRTGIITSIDGNVELTDQCIPSTATASKGIKINISKPLAVIAPKETSKDSIPSEIMETLIDPSQPLPPGEEPVQLNLKPALQGIELKKLPSVRKGTELSGLCSIM